MPAHARTNPMRVEGGVAYIDVSTPRLPGSIVRIDSDDVPLVLDGQGRWFAWLGTKASARTYAKRHRLGSGDAIEYMHRLILGAAAGRFGDHRNGDGLDNRRSNLRAASHAENNRNRVGLAGATSRFKGVSLDRKSGKWFACIKYERRTRSLGHYEDEIAAAQAYDTAAREHFGEFARPNFGDQR